jgi:hypothetical protein
MIAGNELWSECEHLRKQRAFNAEKIARIFLITVATRKLKVKQPFAEFRFGSTHKPHTHREELVRLFLI